MTKTLTLTDFGQFTGTEQWYRHRLVRTVLYTDGVQYMAEHGGAYWLIDEIALAQQFEAKVIGIPFQAWKLTVKDNAATLACEDGNGKMIFSKEIEFTDFPFEEISFYLTDNVLMLPSEY